MLTSDQILKVAKSLSNGYYGSFMSAIGCALLLADKTNTDKLYLAFGDLLERIHAEQFHAEHFEALSSNQ